jgi:hypothetical protein
VTPPYVFASSGEMGMSAGAAMIDPQTRERIGVMLIDFNPESFTKIIQGSNTAIGQRRTGFPILITSEPDVSRYWFCGSTAASRNVQV